MRTCTKLASIEIPPHVFHWNLTFFDFIHQLVVVLFTNRASDDFTNLREQHICALNSLAILVYLHIEGFDFLWIVSHNDWLLEVFLHEIAFMLAGEVASPIDRELEFLLSAGNGFFQNLDSFSVRQTNKVGANHRIESLKESFVNHFIEESKVVLAVVECPLHTVFDEFLFKVHQVLHVDECNFWLYHPEFSQVARGVGILSTECWTKGVDLSKRCCTQFTFELSTDGERCALSEEVIVVDNTSVFVLLQVIKVLGSHLEHLACTFAVAGCDDWRVEIEESSVVEELVNSNSHVVANAENCSKCVGTQTEVSKLTHVLETLSFLLHWIVVRACAKHFYFCCLYFTCLAFAWTFHKFTIHADASSCCDELEHLFIELFNIGNNLHILDGRAIIECYEVNILGTTL